METKKLTPEIIELLNKPLPKEAVKQHPTKKFLSTIKAIYVVERLNECFGIGGWTINNEFVERDKAFVVVKSTFHVPEYGIIIPDIYGGNDNADLGDAYKGACTDALTKIGSYLGIGMDVYKGLNDHPEPKDNKVEDARPWMKEKTLNQAIERIASGQQGKFATMDGFVAEINKTYRISKAYQEKINEALNFIKA